MIKNTIGMNKYTYKNYLFKYAIKYIIITYYLNY